MKSAHVDLVHAAVPSICGTIVAVFALAVMALGLHPAFADAPDSVINECQRETAKPHPDSPFSEAFHRRMVMSFCMTFQGYKPKEDCKDLDDSECYQLISQEKNK